MPRLPGESHLEESANEYNAVEIGVYRGVSGKLGGKLRYRFAGTVDL
jgi:hypothetical protein